MSGTIWLKWGTVKGWENLDAVAIAAMERFAELGMSVGAMQQEMTPAHVDALCNVIDAVDEPIHNDWSGEEMSRDEAKRYVREYAANRYRSTHD